MLQLARGYLAYELTGSAAVLGIVTLGQGLPQLMLSFFGGVIADRVKRRQLLLFSQSCLVVIGLITAVLVHTGLIQVWQLAVLAFAQGAVFAFNQPSRQAYMVELVAQEDVTNAIALYNSGQTCARIIAPSLAGLLISTSFIGLTYSFYFFAACYLIPVLMIFLIRAQPIVSQRVKAPMVTEFVDGLRYISRHKVLRVLIIAGIVPPLLGNSYQQLLPVFASGKALGVGASGLGLMSTFAGVGALLGSLAVASFGNARRRGLIQLSAGAAFGVALVVFSLMHAFPAALASLLFVGFAATSYQTLNSTLIVNSSDPAYYGRVSSVQQVNGSLSSMATLPIGFFVDIFGAPAVVMFNGLFVAGFWCVIGLFVKSYRQIEMQRRPGMTGDLEKTEATI